MSQPAPAATRAAVTTVQRGFLLRALAEPDSGIGLMQAVLDFGEPFVATHFAAALQRAVQRHATLRKAFVRDGDGLWQHVVADVQLPIITLDGSAWREPERSRRLAALLQDDRRRGFDVRQAPLARACIVLLADGHARVLFSYSHLVVDGPSQDHILSEIVRDHDAACAGKHYRPPAAVADTAFYRRWPPTAEQDAAQTFWQEQLRDIEPGSPLASLRSVTPPAARVQQTLRRVLDADHGTALQHAAPALDCSLGMLVYAAWALTLHRISGRNQLAFLTIRSGRNLDLPGIRRMMGPLVNSVPLCLHLTPAMTIADLLQQVGQRWDASAQHEHTALGHISQWSGLGSETWDSNILYHHDRFPSAFARSGTRGQRQAVILEYSDVPLTLSISRGPALGITAQYWSEAFRDRAVTELVDSFTALLLGLGREPHTRIADLDHLTAEQRQRLLRCGRGSDPTAQTPACAATWILHAAFEENARRQPQASALQLAHGSISYAAMDQAATTLAHALRARGVGRGSAVALLSERGAAHLIAMLAILKAGAAFLALEHSHPQAALAATLSDAGIELCLCSDTLASRARDLCHDVLVVGENAPATPLAALPDPAQAHDLAALVATSGTTGRPAIIEIEHRALANVITHSIRCLYTPCDLSLTPWLDSPATDASIHQIFATLGAGGCLLPLASWTELKQSPHFSRLSTLGGTPSVLQALHDGGAIPPRVRAVMTGGEVCPPALIHALRQAGIQRLLNVYGPAEAAIYCTAEDLLAQPPGDDAMPAAIGQPIPGLHIELLDAALRPVMPGQPGEICIAGTGLARGYRNDPERSARRFIQAPTLDGRVNRVYRSGDLGVWLPDGRLQFGGRQDRQLKIHGVRVELDNIEHLLQGLPGVKRAVCALRTGADGRARLLAWVEEEAGVEGVAGSIPHQLRHLLAESLPAAALPSHIIVVERIPCKAGGKPDLDLLPDPASAPEQALPSSDPVHRAIAAEWARLLKHNAFGEDDDFFAAGADSLLGLELLLRLGERFGRRLPPQLPAGSWSIRHLAMQCRAAAPATLYRSFGDGGPALIWLSADAALGADVFHRLALVRPLRVHEYVFARLNSGLVDAVDLADQLYAALRQQQPHGPYRIGAYCLGGLLAVELVRRLEEEGEQVDCLGLVDWHPRSFWRQQEQRLARAMHALRTLRHSMRATALTRRPTLLYQFLRRVVARCRGSDQPHPQLSRAEQSLTLSRPLQAPLLLIETSHTPRQLFSLLPRAGWKRWTHGPVHRLRQRKSSTAAGCEEMLRLLVTNEPLREVQGSGR